jgi:hypothetical protein
MGIEFYRNFYYGRRSSEYCYCWYLFKGIKDFDVQKHKAMLKSADQIENNPLRPELKDYIERFCYYKTKARFLLLKNTTLIMLFRFGESLRE